MSPFSLPGLSRVILPNSGDSGFLSKSCRRLEVDRRFFFEWSLRLEADLEDFLCLGLSLFFRCRLDEVCSVLTLDPNSPIENSDPLGMNEESSLFGPFSKALSNSAGSKEELVDAALNTVCVVSLRLIECVVL